MHIYWITVIFAIFTMGTGLLATEVFKIFGENSRTATYWLGLMGISATTFFYFLMQKWDQMKQKRQQASKAAEQLSGGGGGGGAAAGSGGGDEGDIGDLVKDAETKLASSKLGQNASLSGLPVIFLLGDQNSTKTTVVMNSGMEPELLAGQVYQQDNVITPTRTANFWFAKKAVFVEAGGKFWLDAEAWTRLLKKMSPPKMKSVFGGAPTAPRAAVLCVDVERFFQPGASDAMATAARGIQSRLQEISAQFGISFPVYVIFTRCDRVPFFLDYVRNLSTQEATQVFGTTLPMRAAKGGVYAEEETQRLNEMFNELFYSLCDKRIEFLPRENDHEKLPGCYEFPREFRKIRSALVQFLVDVGRPSQLATSPFLRGFYFTGVRPVFVNDVAPNPVFQKPQSAFNPVGGATTMFKMGDIQQQVPMAAPQQGGGRKVPQWVFLSHLFNDVILEDKAALGASEASTKTSGLQRVLLGAGAALALLWTVLATVSFFNNRALESEIIDATKALKTVKLANNAAPAEEDLKKLAGLREKLAMLTKWSKDGHPLMYGWGLYIGDDLLRPTRKAYYDGFQQLLFRDTQMTRMLTSMQALQPGPAQAQDRCQFEYNTLRAYLISTSQWKRIEPQGEADWMRGTLQERWALGREAEIGDARMKAAGDEFAFYAGDLINGNPYSDREDVRGVDNARQFQANCSGLNAIYSRMVGEANQKNPKANYNAQYDWTSKVVLNNKDVPGAFTKKGWDFVRKYLSGSQDLSGEEWVLGPPDKYRRSEVNRATLKNDLWTMYTDEFIQRWREYFSKNTRVLPYAGPSDAADKLNKHSESRAPIIFLVGLASQQTAVEPANDPWATKVRNAFFWAHQIVPPGGDYVGGKNQPYVGGLQGLAVAVGEAAKNMADVNLVNATGSKRTEALTITRSVATFGKVDLEGKLDQAILDIMMKPIEGVEGLFSPARMANQAAGQMCQQFNAITNRFPFNPNVQPEVGVAELNEMLRPGTGKFWQFYDAQLKPHLNRDGTPTAGSAIQFNSNFLRFFREVTRLSDALYRGGQDPRLAYSIQYVGADLLIDNAKASKGDFSVDGKVAKLGGPAVPYTWTGAAHVVRSDYDGPTFAEHKDGIWQIFRFFVAAEVTPQGNQYLITYPVFSGNPARRVANVKYLADLQGAPAVFDRKFLSGLRCVANVGR